MCTELMPDVTFTHHGAIIRGTELSRLMHILRGFTRDGAPSTDGGYLGNKCESLRRTYNMVWDRAKANPGQWVRLYDIDGSMDALAYSLYWAQRQLDTAEYGLDAYIDAVGEKDAERVFLQAQWGQ